jgi:biotin transporter BioY
VAGLLAEVVLFAIGLGWLAIWAGSLKRAFLYGLYWFVFAEVIKILLAAAVAVRVKRSPREPA